MSVSMARHPRVANAIDKAQQYEWTRILTFGTYALTFIAGLVAFLNLPYQLLELIGPTLLTVFGIFGCLGSILCMVSIFPNIRWLEQVGLLLLLTSILMYAVMLLSLDGVPIGLFFGGALGMSFIKRLVEVRK